MYNPGALSNIISCRKQRPTTTEDNDLSLALCTRWFLTLPGFSFDLFFWEIWQEQFDIFKPGIRVVLLTDCPVAF